MPALLSLHQVSFATPDGRDLFTDLDLNFGPQRTGLVGRNGVGKSTLLKLITGELSPRSGEVVRNGTLGILRQSVQTGDGTVADALGIAEALQRLDRIEAGLGTVEDAGEADWNLPSRLDAVLAQVSLPGLTPDRPLDSLSGGQRTRVSLAALLLAEPDMILLDEPTNNLDAEGREAVAEVLRSWRGGAIVVSHDRALLRHMDAIVELTTLGAKLYGGNYDVYDERKAIELAAAEQTLAVAERRIGEVDRKIRAQQERKARNDANGKRKAARGDIPKILIGGRKENAENSSGEGARLAARQREAAAGDLAEARSQVEILKTVSIKLPSTGLPSGKTVLQVDGLSGGPDAEKPVIRNFSMKIVGPERVAITGANGSGKTSLLRLIVGNLVPVTGVARVPVPFAMLDQTVSLLDPALTIRDNFRALNPQDNENACRAALARFMFRADAALQVAGSLSGGEMLRAGLACTLGGKAPPQLLILDEPTNHLDLSAIGSVEAGLRGYDGALLVVSHDREFLERIGVEREVGL